MTVNATAPKPTAKFSLADLKSGLVKKEKSMETPAPKSVHVPATRQSKRKKGPDSAINLESFEDLTLDETKDKLLLGVNHVIQLAKQNADELLAANERCLDLKKIAAKKDAWYKQQDEALKRELAEQAEQAEEERKVLVEEAKASATTSVIEAMYEMAKEAAVAGFSLPTWDVKGWAQMLGKAEDEVPGVKAGEGAGASEGASGGAGAGMGDEGCLNA